MTLVTSFTDLVQPLAATMTTPTANNFFVLVTGWVFAPRRTVTGMIVAAQAVGLKHHASFHRFFAEAVWSLDRLGLAVFDLIEPFLDDADGVVDLGLDDTLARKRGMKMFGVGMHHDPMLSSRGKTVTNWGHSWVVLSVIVKMPFCSKRCFALPILFRLYLNKKAAARHRRVYRTRPELAVQLLGVLCSARKSRRFHVIADSAYGGKSVLNQLPDNCELTSRLLMDARLYEAAPVRKPGTKGRPRKRGKRLPSPQQMLEQRARRVDLKIYGRTDRVRLVDAEARVYAAPDRPLRVVAVDPLVGGRPRQAFYSTRHQATPEQVLMRYAMRWSVEVTFHDAKQSLGFEQPQGWTRKAVQRTAPMAMLLYSLIVLWFAKVGHRHYQPPNRPWYPHKPHASFADMLATLRGRSVREQVLSTGLCGRGSRKVIDTLVQAVQRAASARKSKEEGFTFLRSVTCQGMSWD